MKKFLVLLLMFCFSLPVYSTEAEDIEVLNKLGFLDKVKVVKVSPISEIKQLFKMHEKYTNAQNIKELGNLYADKYVSFDGFSKSVYLTSAEKSWKTYKNLAYKCRVKSIRLTDETHAIAETEEYINGLSYVGKKYIQEGYGYLSNFSESVYMLEKINGKWQIVSDNIYLEQTVLNYGNARFTPASLVAPSQVNAGENYVIGLNVFPPKDSIVVASIGREEITYPQVSAEEIFRNLPDSNTLERVVKANTKNINEYAVSFFVIMKTNNSEDIENLKMQVSGVGLAMNRVNVIPRNKYIKVDDEKNKK